MKKLSKNMFFLIEKHKILTKLKKIKQSVFNSLTTAFVCSTGTYDSPCKWSNLGLLMMDMTTMVSISFNGSPCSKTFMKNLTTMIWTAKRGSSVKSWENLNILATWPKNSNLDFSKLKKLLKTKIFKLVYTILAPVIY